MTLHLILRLFWTAAIISKVTVCLAATVLEDSACYGTGNTGDCFTHNLHCQQGKGIFIVEAERGFKPNAMECASQIGNCLDTQLCCSYNRSDCLNPYKRRDFFHLTKDCLRRGACIYGVSEDYQKSSPCNEAHSKTSEYSRIRYLCLEDSSITSFTTSTSILGSAIAVVYNRSQVSTTDRNRNLTCLVEAADCGQQKSSILLYKSPNQNTAKSFTSLGFSSNEWLNRSKNVGVHRSRSAKTPYNFSLRIVTDDNVEVGLAVIYAHGKTKLRVTCRAKGARFPECVAPTSSAAEQTQSTETSHSRESTATSKEADTSREATPNLSEASRTPPPAGPAINEGGYSGIQDKHADRSSNKDKVMTVGVAAGTVGGLVLIAASVAIATVCYRRRRRPKDTSPQVLTTFKNNSSQGATPQNGQRTLDVDSLGLKNPAVDSTVPGVPPSLRQEPMDAATSPTSGHDNSEGDYDHLGCKRPTPAPRSDVTYGHLSGAGDVTESDYDHVIRNRKPTSDNVIDNLYDTTKPATSVKRGDDNDDDYNVVVASGRRQEVVNNIYDTAGPPPATGDGDVVDYNALGPAQNRPDVINNIYDTADNA